MSDATNRAKPAEALSPDHASGEVRRHEKGLGEEASRRIGDELKAFYDGLVQEPLPDRFVQLLQQLEQREAPGRAEKAGAGTSDDDNAGGGR